METIRIFHRPTGILLAEGPVGWGITPFEGNFYISKKYLKTKEFRPSYIPGFCIYKFFYVWMDLRLDDGVREKALGWLYWLPNPLLPFIWFRLALPASHPAIEVEKFDRQTE